MLRQNFLIVITLLGITFAGVKGPKRTAFRAKTMGNAFVAVVEDHNAMYYNVAGLNLINKLGRVDNGYLPLSYYPNGRNHFFGLNIQALVAIATVCDLYGKIPIFCPQDGVFKELESEYSSVELNDQQSPGDVLFEEGQIPNIVKSFITVDRLAIPAFLGLDFRFVKPNFGAAVWAEFQSYLFVDRNLFLPSVGFYESTIDLVGKVAIAGSDRSNKLSIGIGFKGVHRVQQGIFERFVGSINDNTVDVSEQFSTIPRELFSHFQNSINILPRLLTIPNFALDFGVLYQYNLWTRFGASLQNLFLPAITTDFPSEFLNQSVKTIFSGINGESVVPDLTVGVAFSPVLFQQNYTKFGFVNARKVNIAIDFEDMLSTQFGKYHIQDKINLGAEIEQTFLYGIFFRVAVGMKSLLPSYGFTMGIDLPYVALLQIDYGSWIQRNYLYELVDNDRIHYLGINIEFL